MNCQFALTQQTANNYYTIIIFLQLKDNYLFFFVCFLIKVKSRRKYVENVNKKLISLEKSFLDCIESIEVRKIVHEKCVRQETQCSNVFVKFIELDLSPVSFHTSTH